jgi:4-hydroxy-tetrahydrodipicolinate reductase
MTTINLGITGAAGRMGQRLVALAAADPLLNIVCALETSTSPKIGADAGETAGIGRINVPITDEFAQKVDVLIDFSSPKSTDSIVRRCVERKLPLVFATTGTTEQQNAGIREAATQIPVLFSPSMSMAVNVAMKLCEMAAKTLATKDADVEIIEKHHRFKVDSPSGTALKFGKIIADEMGITGMTSGRHGVVGERPHNEIGYHAVRIGDNPGEHTILFGMLGETLEITVKASNRDCYALGALAAAKFLHEKPAGLYSMNDVLKIA